jgi:hypothetical protein
MTSKYRIEIELLLDESTATQALALARDIYLQRGGARTVESGIEREMSEDDSRSGDCRLAPRPRTPKADSNPRRNEGERMLHDGDNGSQMP